MQQQTDFRKLDDPEFLAKRSRVRQQLEQLPGDHPGRPELAELYADMTDEFDRRARRAWQAGEAACHTTSPAK